MGNEESPTKRRCQAMIDANIEDPDSAEGILFCTGSNETESRCPYDYCVVFEHRLGTSNIGKQERRRIARDLHRHGVSVKDIALILDKKVTTVKEYLRK